MTYRRQRNLYLSAIVICSLGAFLSTVEPVRGAWQERLPAPRDQMDDEDGPAQRIIVRERFAGWRQAQRDGSGIDEALRANWVMLSSSGILNGEIIATQEAEVGNVLITLLNRGQVINQTRTDAKGKFSFNNLIEGTYAIAGFGPNTFFAFSLNILDYRDSTHTAHPSTLRIPAVQNKTTINLDWIRHFAASNQFRVYGRFVSLEGSTDPAWLYGRDGLSNHGPSAIPSSSVNFHPALLGPAGELAGRIHQIDELNGRPVDVRSTRVMLLGDDNVVAAVTADNFGIFRFENVSPGQYSLVAVGTDGMACIGIDVVKETQGAQVLDVSLVSPETVGWLNHVAAEAAYQRIVNRKRPPSECQECNQFCGDLRSLYCTRNTFFRQFWDTFNQFSDQLFYGESFNYYDGRSGFGDSYSGYGYGYGNWGYNGYGQINPGPAGSCNACGGAGCPTCQPMGVSVHDPYGFGIPSPVQPCCPTGSLYTPAPVNGNVPNPAPVPTPETLDGELAPIPMSFNSQNRPARR